MDDYKCFATNGESTRGQVTMEIVNADFGTGQVNQTFPMPMESIVVIEDSVLGGPTKHLSCDRLVRENRIGEVLDHRFERQRHRDGHRPVTVTARDDHTEYGSTERWVR